jgi:hypothetical protein
MSPAGARVDPAQSHASPVRHSISELQHPVQFGWQVPPHPLEKEPV